MDTHPDKSLKLQFSIAKSFPLIAAFAIYFWLAKRWNGDGGYWKATMVCALPMAVLIEWIFERPINTSPLKRLQQYRQCACVIACCVMPIFIGIVGGLATSSYLSLLLHSSSLVDSVAGIPWPIAGLLIPGMVFFVLCLPCIRYDHLRLPIRSIVLLAILTLTSVHWFVYALWYWHQTKHAPYVSGWMVINATAIVLLWFTAWMLRREDRNSGVLIAWNLVLTCWIFGFSHPWLGEFVYLF